MEQTTRQQKREAEGRALRAQRALRSLLSQLREIHRAIERERRALKGVRGGFAGQVYSDVKEAASGEIYGHGLGLVIAELERACDWTPAGFAAYDRALDREDRAMSAFNRRPSAWREQRYEAAKVAAQAAYEAATGAASTPAA